MFRPAGGYLQACLARGLESYIQHICLRYPVVTEDISIVTITVNVVCYTYFVDRSVQWEPSCSIRAYGRTDAHM
jgi:hypothetical protein